MTGFSPLRSRRLARRWLALALAGCLLALGFSIEPSRAQTLVSTGAFCEANSDPIRNPQQGRSYGDPHINTYDGLHYSFQTIGEYILSKSQDGSFEVQARQGRVADSNALSLNTAVAMNVCGQRVAIYVSSPNSSALVRVNGQPTTITDGAIALENGGEVQELRNGNFAVLWPSGDQVNLNMITVGGDRFLNIMPILRPSHANTMTGLLGNFNGNANDDLMGRDGRVVPAQSTYSIATNALDRVLPAAIPVRQVENAYFENLYRQFGDSWRIRPEESLFDYRTGESTETFSDRAFPQQFFTLNQVAPAQVEAALNTCRDAGVEEALLDGCVFDVAATGENRFVNAAVNAIANAVTRRIRDRAIDEVRDRIPIPRFPF